MRHEPTDKLGGDTAGVTWSASRALADVMSHQRSNNEQQMTVLELGCGTGFLAMALAVDGCNVIATDVRSQMRALRRNVNLNRLGHKVRCVPWDWSAEVQPDNIDWSAITHCIGAELVCYNEHGTTSAALARTLATVLERCRAGIEVKLMMRSRLNTGSAERSVMEPSNSYDARSAVWRFVELELPLHGLFAKKESMDEYDLTRYNVCGLGLYSVHISLRMATLPAAMSFIAQGMAATTHISTWRRWRAIGAEDAEATSTDDPSDACAGAAEGDDLENAFASLEDYEGGEGDGDRSPSPRLCARTAHPCPTAGL